MIPVEIRTSFRKFIFPPKARHQAGVPPALFLLVFIGKVSTAQTEKLYANKLSRDCHVLSLLFLFIIQAVQPYIHYALVLCLYTISLFL